SRTTTTPAARSRSFSRRVPRNLIVAGSRRSCPMQSFRPLSRASALASSQVSPPDPDGPLTKPSPQKVQSARQALPLGSIGTPGGSHVSPGSTMPLPQNTSTWQVALQPSPSSVLPSSHCSPPVTMPLPQPVGLQLESHPSPSARLPSSQ